MQFKIETIPFEQIDLEDKRYQITTDTTVDNIKASIERCGLVNPPILYRNSSHYIILSGFRRINACLLLKRDDVSASILDPNSTGLERARVAVIDNALQRPLNLIEISRAFELLSTVLDNKDAIAQEASMLGIPSNPDFIQKAQQLCKLPSPVQDAVANGIVSLPVALELSSLTPDVSTVLADLFRDLKIGLNKQREVITFIKEIAIRENLKVSDILNDADWLNITAGEDADRSLQRRKIRQYLKQRRFPAISFAENAFKKHKKNLDLGKRIKLAPPRNFEGNTYTLSVDFKNIQELEAGLARLDKISKHPEIRKILHE